MPNYYFYLTAGTTYLNLLAYLPVGWFLTEGPDLVLLAYRLPPNTGLPPVAASLSCVLCTVGDNGEQFRVCLGATYGYMEERFTCEAT